MNGITYDSCYKCYHAYIQQPYSYSLHAPGIGTIISMTGEKTYTLINYNIKDNTETNTILMTNNIPITNRKNKTRNYYVNLLGRYDNISISRHNVFKVRNNRIIIK